MILQRYQFSRIRSVVGLSLLMAITSVRAHLMVEQHGTINFANGGAFLVLSVPVSAFDGVDDDGDGALSVRELGRHITEVEQQFYNSVQLLGGRGEPLPLQGLLMSLAPSDHAAASPAKQLIAFGRFAVTGAMTSLDLRITLQGKNSEEKSISVTATRDRRSQEMVFTPDRQYHSIFPATILNKSFAEQVTTF